MLLLIACLLISNTYLMSGRLLDPTSKEELKTEELKNLDSQTKDTVDDSGSETETDIESTKKHTFKRRRSMNKLLVKKRAKRMLLKVDEIISRKNGLRISPDSDYDDRLSKLDLMCEKLHPFTSAAKYLIRGSWCRDCKIAENRLSEATLHGIAQSYGGKYVGKKYKNNKTRIKWKCAKGHPFMRSVGSIRVNQSFCTNVECRRK